MSALTIPTPLIARDTIAERDADEITARMPAFVQTLARTLVSPEVVPAPRTMASPVIPPPRIRPLIGKAPSRIEPIEEDDEPTKKAPPYTQQLAEAIITGENVSLDGGPTEVEAVLVDDEATQPNLEIPTPLSFRPIPPMSRRLPTRLLEVAEAREAVANPPPPTDVAPPPAIEDVSPAKRDSEVMIPGIERRPSRLPLVGSLLVAALSLTFAAFTALGDHGATPIARTPHTPVGAGAARACVAELRSLAPSPLAPAISPVKTASFAPHALTPLRRASVVAAPPGRGARSSSSKIVRVVPF